MLIALLFVSFIALGAGCLAALMRRRMLAMQSALEEAQRQESLGTLAGGIAHDFNNILGAILGFSLLLEEDLHAQPDSLTMAAEISTATRRGQGIVAQLMRYSRKNAEQSSALRLPVSVSELIDELPNAVMNGQAGQNLKTFIRDARGRRTIIAVTHRGDMMALADTILRLAPDEAPLAGRKDEMIKKIKEAA